MPSPHVAAVLPAGGSGSRFGHHQNKIFALLDGKPIWWHAVSRLTASPTVVFVTIAISQSDRELLLAQRVQHPVDADLRFAASGSQRFHSVASAIQSIGDDASIDLIAIHDAARPMLPREDLDAVIQAADRSGAAMLATPMTGSVKRGVDGRADCRALDRRDLWIALTPQVFKRQWIGQAYERHRGKPVTDDAELVEATGRRVELVPGSAANLKITYPEDLRIAEAMLNHDG